MELSVYVDIGECHFEALESLLVLDPLQLYPYPWGLCCLRAAHSSCPLQPTPTCHFSLRSSSPCGLSWSFTPPAPSLSACTHASPSQPVEATRTTQGWSHRRPGKVAVLPNSNENQMSKKRDEHVSDERTTKMQEKPIMKQISNLPEKVFREIVIEHGRRMEELRTSTKS